MKTLKKQPIATSKVALEQQYTMLVEESYNLSQTDADLSDYADFEADKIFQQLITFKTTQSLPYAVVE